MKLTIARLIIFIAGLLCVLAGLYVLWKPLDVASRLYYSFDALRGLSEFLVFYGGFSVGLGAFFLIGAIVKKYLEASLLLLSVSSLAALLTRLAIILGSEVTNSFYMFFSAEILLFLLGSLGWIFCIKHFKQARAKRNFH